MAIWNRVPAQPFIISLLIHLCLYLLAQLTPSTPNRPPQEVEIVYQNETTQPGRQFVTDPNKDNLENALEKLKEQTKRLSQHTRRYQREQVARQSGRTENSQYTRQRQRSATPSPAQSQNQEPQSQLGANGDLAVSPLPLPGVVGHESRTGYSALAEFVPDVQQGGFTSLNSDQFVHYTFYARTNEQIRNRWVALIRNFVNNHMVTDINQLAQKTQMTEVEIILNPDGHFEKAILRQGAESRELDEIAITAFRLAAPFNNPPSEMVADDGFIHLHYGFHVQFRPRFVANGSK